MVLPSLYRRVFKVFYRGLSLAVVRVWMSFTGLGSAVTFAQLVIYSFCRRFMQNSVVARGASLAIGMRSLSSRARQVYSVIPLT